MLGVVVVVVVVVGGESVCVCVCGGLGGGEGCASCLVIYMFIARFSNALSFTNMQYC